MASNRTGNPTATQSPSATPGTGVYPTQSIPAGTDAPTIESITQAMTVNSDFIAWIQNFLVGTDHVRLREDWIGKDTGVVTSATPIANFPRWSAFSSGSSVGVRINAASTTNDPYAGPVAVINMGTTNASYTSLATAGAMVQLSSSNPASMFFEAIVCPNVAGIWNFAIGFDASQTPLETGASDLNILFTASNTAPNWKAQTRNGVTGNTTSTDTGIAWANSTYYKLRIIYTPSAVTFYVNGTLVATNTTNIPSIGGSNFYVAATAASGDTTIGKAFYLGTINAVVTR